MKTLVSTLAADFPAFTFVPGEVVCWSPQKNQISYSPGEDQANAWGLLHELGHALLDHQSYDTDIALLRKEASAWAKAGELAERYGLQIDDDYIQRCLDSYRDWLHKRSSCPRCGAQGLQKTSYEYRCINCRMSWHVSAARFCRAYRRTSSSTPAH